MLVGLMAIWAGLGTFSFSDYQVVEADGQVITMPGIFSQVRPAANDHRLQVPEGMVKLAARNEIEEIVGMARSCDGPPLPISFQFPKRARNFIRGG